MRAAFWYYKERIMRIILVFSITLGVIFVAGFLVRNIFTQEEKINTSAPAVPEEKIGGSSPVSPDAAKIFSSVSLPALMEKEFDGRDLKLRRVLAENESYTRYYITYKSGELTISGIMNVPKGEGPFPVLFLNHGYIAPAVYTNGRGLKREQDYLARAGYVVVHSDYRNHADSDKDPSNEVNFRLGYTDDVINAIMAVKNSGLSFVDASRVGLLGHSMGGGVSLNIMVVRPDLVDGVVLFAPVSADFRDNFTRWLERRPEVAQEIISTYGRPEDNPGFWDNISASTFFERAVMPVMIHHGTADKDVPIAWSDVLYKALIAHNDAVTYHVYPNEPHEFTVAWPEVMKKTKSFFDANVMKSPQ